MQKKEGSNWRRRSIEEERGGEGQIKLKVFE